MARLSAAVLAYRPWFLGTSMLLIVGMVQVPRLQRRCRTRSHASILIFALSATIVLLVVFFPHVIASLIADWLP